MCATPTATPPASAIQNRRSPFLHPHIANIRHVIRLSTMDSTMVDSTMVVFDDSGLGGSLLDLYSSEEDLLLFVSDRGKHLFCAV